MFKLFITNVNIYDLIFTLFLIGSIIAVDVVLFTHPKTKDYFTKER